MNIILEVWDIHEHKYKNNQLFIDKKFILKDSLFFGHQQLSF